ncbi:signal peptidase I [Microbacterium laevaniformans]|uniref:Signal peptidase I n=2 Tax=Microbacterium TaxID=33882 RepID=A0A4S2DA67_9MICO|nr:signal peptidase I [Microbacterium laevaniformans]TGY38335.1 signal peptidase I [Microbacterium laevaniformans]
MTTSLPSSPMTERDAAADAGAAAPRRFLRLLRMLRGAGLWLGALLGVASALIVIVCLLFQMRPQVVISGSMEPALPVGSLLLVVPTSADEIRPGDIITVNRPGGRGLVTHRVVTTSVVDGRATVELKGDANATVDPDAYVVGAAERVVLAIPWAGYVAVAVKSPPIMAALVVAVIAVIGLGLLPARERASG